MGTLPGGLIGEEWLVDAGGCDPARLRDRARLQALCERVIAELDLRLAAPPVWHVFPGAGGVTGLYLLTESHLACHTYPEHGVATFNLHCCRARPEWPWGDRLAAALGAARVRVRRFARGTGDAASDRAKRGSALSEARRARGSSGSPGLFRSAGGPSPPKVPR